MSNPYLDLACRVEAELLRQDNHSRYARDILHGVRLLSGSDLVNGHTVHYSRQRKNLIALWRTFSGDVVHVWPDHERYLAAQCSEMSDTVHAVIGVLLRQPLSPMFERLKS